MLCHSEGETMIEIQNYVEARGLFQKAIEAANSNSIGTHALSLTNQYMALGGVCFKMKDFHASKLAFKNALYILQSNYDSSKPNLLYESALLALSKIALKSNHIAKCEKYLLRARESASPFCAYHRIRICKVLSRMHIASKQYEQALWASKHIEGISLYLFGKAHLPNLHAFILTQGYLLYKTMQYRMAEQYVDWALRLLQNIGSDCDISYMKASCFYRKGAISQSLAL